MTSLLDQLTDEQVAAATSKASDVILTAAAGAGKTRVLVARIVHLIESGVEPELVVAFTFTRSACEEIRSRVADVVGVAAARRVTISTFHAYAARFVVPEGCRVATEIEARAAQDSVLKREIDGARNPMFVGGLCGVLAYDTMATAREADPGAKTREIKFVLSRLADQRLIPTWELLPRLLESGTALPPARHVLVDEAQDITLAEGLLLSRIPAPDGQCPHHFAVHDPRQCIPEGQLVATPEGPIPIERLRVGDHVLSSIGGVLTPCDIERISESQHEKALEFTTETGTTFRATPNHLLFAALGRPDGHYVYLMFRHGFGFRVGVSSLGLCRDNPAGLRLRLHGERAERMWILAHTEDACEAHRIGHSISYRFRVPMAPFRPRPGTMFRTEGDAREFFAEFKTWGPLGQDVLRAFGQDFEHPAYIAKSSGRGRIAVNLLIGGGRASEVAVESALVPETVGATLGFRERRRGCLGIRRNFALASDARAYAAQLAEEVGGYVVEALSVPESEHRVHPVRAAGVFPTMFVPEAGPDGIVRMVRVVSRTEVRAGRCFDLEVPKSLNFVVGRAVVHNSIMGWRGASGVDALAWMVDPQRLSLTRCFRFGPEIAEVANRVAAAFGGDPIVGAGPAGTVARTSTADFARHENGLVLARTNLLASQAQRLYAGVKHVRRDPLDALARDADNFGEAWTAGYGVASTVHSAKGREADAVVIMDHEDPRSEFPKRKDEEDLRVLYVAVTRARTRLHIGTLSRVGEEALGATAIPEQASTAPVTAAATEDSPW